MTDRPDAPHERKRRASGPTIPEDRRAARQCLLRSAAEDDPDLADEARDLFAAIYGREPDADDGDASDLISLCYAGI